VARSGEVRKTASAAAAARFAPAAEFIEPGARLKRFTGTTVAGRWHQPC
jgi:hypothetical protein